MSEGPARPVARRNENPRRVVGGQRLLRADGFGPWPWPAEGWLLRVRAAGEEESMEGLAYAKSGQVATLSIAPGRVTAAVQGRMPRPHGVTVDWPPIEPSVIDLILRRLAADPAAAASVLLGEVPRSIESTFREHGVALSPCEGEPVRFCCSCGRLSGCRHEIAVAWILQDRIASDAWALLRLRGLDREDVQDRVRLARRSGDEASSLGLASPGTPYEAPIEEFWRPGASLSQLESMPPAHHAPMALLRRLGPSPLEGRFPLVGLLASAYETIASRGTMLASTGDAVESSPVHESVERRSTDQPGESGDAASPEISVEPRPPSNAGRPLGRAVAKRKTPPAPS
ncbi:MAG: hypothetical protein ACO3EP_12760 [Phycisphaerales bacterium]